MSEKKAAVFVECSRTGYNPDQVYTTMTVGELIECLEQFDPDAEIFTSHDGGYTYGGFGWEYFFVGEYDGQRVYVDGEDLQD